MFFCGSLHKAFKLAFLVPLLSGFLRTLRHFDIATSLSVSPLQASQAYPKHSQANLGGSGEAVNTLNHVFSHDPTWVLFSYTQPNPAYEFARRSCMRFLTMLVECTEAFYHRSDIAKSSIADGIPKQGFTNCGFKFQGPILFGV